MMQEELVRATPPQRRDSGAVTACRVSVVLPVYNEGQRIRQTIQRVQAYAAGHPDYEWLFVNDGSSDATRAILDEWLPGGCDESGRVRSLHLARNGGKGRAIAQGFEHARGERLLFTDGDLAYDLDYLPKLVAALDKADVVMGSRRVRGCDGARQPSKLRMVMGETFNFLVRLYAGLPYRDTQAGIKGFRAEAVRRIFPFLRVNGYAIDVEIIFLARKRRLRIVELPVVVGEDHAAKPTSVNLMVEPIRMWVDVVRMRYRWWQGMYG